MECEIEKVSLAVQINGQAYFVALPQESLLILVKMAQGLSDDGSLALPVKKAPPGYVFYESEEK
jgi:hypothetical protein